MSRIVIIATSEGMANLCHQLMPEFSEDVDIRVGIMEYALKVAEVLDGEDTDVIITRGGTAELMKKAGIKTPVVEIPITGRDMVIAIKEAGRLSHTQNPVIGYIGFKNMVDNIRMYSDILSENIKIYEVNSGKEIEQTVKKAVEDKIDVIIGGIATVEAAGRNGIPAVTLEATKESIMEAFVIAKQIKYGRTLEKQKANELRTILNSTFEAIIGIDEKGNITVFNAAAERFLKIKTQAAIGRFYRDIVPIIDSETASKVIKEGQSIASKLVRLNGVSLVLNFIPIQGAGKIEGAIMSFEETDKLQSVETKIRKELYLKGNTAEYTFDDIYGESHIFSETKRVARSFAGLDSIVLIIGETGTGKELFAQSIHNASNRANGPFVAVNCGAIPSNLIESELFGYAEGAFTGAKKGGKQGLFELAHKGTIFLDEISEMDIYGQVILLRAIQEKQIRRVGDDKVIPVDVRIIAATNKSLYKLVEDSKFREDLYYRLNVLTLNLPPLRDRKEDIALLLAFFLEEYEKKFSKKVRLTSEATEVILNNKWYGNVRQLQNFCERLVAVAYTKELNGDFVRQQIENRAFSLETGLTAVASDAVSEKEATKNMVREEYGISPDRIIRTLSRNEGNRELTAKELNISRSTLWRYIRKYSIKTEYKGK